MRMVILLLAVFLLVACNAPTVQNLGAPSRVVEANGMKFKVIYASNQAEAFRLNTLSPRHFRKVPAAAHEAIEKASGCRVVQSTLAGDPARMTADLVC